jgi:hypothetical protein
MYRFVLGVVLGVGACSVPEVEPEALASGQCVRVGSEVVCPGDLPSRHRPLPASTSALNRATCRELLDRSGMDRINTCPLQPGDAGEVKLPAEALCMRDSYVLTALVY